MDNLELKLYDKKVKLAPEIGQYFEAQNYYVAAKLDIEKSLRKYHEGDFKFFESQIKEKLGNNVKELEKYILLKLSERKLPPLTFEAHTMQLDKGLEELFDRLYHELLEKVKSFTNEVNYPKIDEFRTSVDRNVELIFLLAEEYNSKKELLDYWETMVFPKFIIGLNNRMKEFYEGVLQLFLGNLNIDFNQEHSKKILEDLRKDFKNVEDTDLDLKTKTDAEKKKTTSQTKKKTLTPEEELKKQERDKKATGLIEAIEAYPLSVVEDSNMLFLLLQDKDIHDSIVELIKFIHAENSCFIGTVDLIREDFYKNSIDNHRENYKNIYYKCLRYREELCKVSAKESIDRCYKDIYKDVVGKIATIEDLILNERRIDYLCSVLSLDKEEISLKILERIENANIDKFYEQRKSIDHFDSKKVMFAVIVYVAILVFLLFQLDMSPLSKFLIIYIYLFFGYVAYVFYGTVVRENKSKYDGIFENFMAAHDKKVQYAEKVIRFEKDPNKLERLKYRYLQSSKEVNTIIENYNQTSNNKLLNVQALEIKIGNKNVKMQPVIICILFLIWFGIILISNMI